METKQEKPIVETEEKKGGAAEMEARAIVETQPRKEVLNEAVAKILSDPSRSFSEQMDEVNKLFKQGRIPFEVFFETVSGLAEKHAEVEGIKREIALKEAGIKSANSEVKELHSQELLIRQMLNQDTLRALREVVRRAVSEAATLEDAEALMSAGIAEVIIRPATQPEKIEDTKKEGKMLKIQAEERIQELKSEIRKDAELKRLENLNQKAIEHIPALAKNPEDVDKSEALSVLDDYLLTEKEKLNELALSQPEIVFIRKRGVSLLKEWLNVWKEVLSEEDKLELEERIRRLPGEVMRRVLKEALE